MNSFTRKHPKLCTALVLIGALIAIFVITNLPDIIEDSKRSDMNKKMLSLRDEAYRCSESADKAITLMFSPTNSNSGDFTTEFIPDDLKTEDATQVRYLVKINADYYLSGNYVTANGTNTGGAFRWRYDITLIDLLDGTTIAEDSIAGSSPPSETKHGTDIGERPSDERIIAWIRDNIALAD